MARPPEGSGSAGDSLRFSAAALLGLLAAAAAAGCGREAGAPKLVLEQEGHDFGRLPPGAEAVHRFKVRNDGNATLVVRDLRSSCNACTAARPKPRKIPPGGTGVIEVVFNSLDHRGPVGRSVEVHTNDPARRVATLAIRAEVGP